MIIHCKISISYNRYKFPTRVRWRHRHAIYSLFTSSFLLLLTVKDKHCSYFFFQHVRLFAPSVKKIVCSKQGMNGFMSEAAIDKTRWRRSAGVEPIPEYVNEKCLRSPTHIDKVVFWMSTTLALERKKKTLCQ